MDKINPKHYKDNVIETIDAIESQMSDKEFVGYLKGSVLKYMCRSGKKVGVSTKEDYQKAEWYLQRLIDRKDKYLWIYILKFYKIVQASSLMYDRKERDIQTTESLCRCPK